MSAAPFCAWSRTHAHGHEDEYEYEYEYEYGAKRLVSGPRPRPRPRPARVRVPGSLFRRSLPIAGSTGPTAARCDETLDVDVDGGDGAPASTAAQPRAACWVIAMTATVQRRATISCRRRRRQRSRTLTTTSTIRRSFGRTGGYLRSASVAHNAHAMKRTAAAAAPTTPSAERPPSSGFSVMLMFAGNTAT